MTALLPTNYTVITASGSQWTSVVTVYNDDGSLADLTGKSFEFVVRNATSPNPNVIGSIGAVVFSVNNTSSTANGTINVTVSSSQVQVIVTATAVNLLTQGGGVYTLWMDPSLADATALVTGQFLTQPVPAP